MKDKHKTQNDPKQFTAGRRKVAGRAVIGKSLIPRRSNRFGYLFQFVQPRGERAVLPPDMATVHDKRSVKVVLLQPPVLPEPAVICI